MGITGGNAEIANGIQDFEYLEGKSIKFNQLVATSNLNDAEEVYGITRTISGTNGLTYSGTCSNTTSFTCVKNITFISSHVYYVSLGKVTLPTGSMLYIGSTTDKQTEAVFTNVGQVGFSVYLNAGVVTNFTVYPIIVDLTAIYGAGNEPTSVADFKKDFPCDYYAYNSGSILSAKSSALVSRGRQQWDEEWELGIITLNTGTSSDGQNAPSTTQIRGKNYIPVIAGQDYFLKYPTGTAMAVAYYDINKNFLGYSRSADYGGVGTTTTSPNSTLTIPSGVSYIRFYMGSAYGTTYQHDITISIYFEDGEGYDQYYPYQAQTVELPNIELRGIGDIKDIAYKQGGGKSKLFEYTVIGTEGVVDIGNWRIGAITLRIPRYNTTCPKASTTSALNTNILCSGWNNMNVFCDTNNYNYFYFLGLSSSITTEASFRTWVAGMHILYELDQERDIENPGWTNVLVDNYGTLQFTTDPQQVPQVEQPYFIKYTISLKEFLDGSYVRAGGNPNDFALLEDVDALKNDLVDGNITVSKALSSKQLDNVSTESGNTQETPFVLQGTGTANGTASVDTGLVGNHLAKQGNSVVRNQWFQNPTFVNTDNWRLYNNNHGIISANNNILTITYNDIYSGGYNDGLLQINGTYIINSNDYYMMYFEAKADFETQIGIEIGSGVGSIKIMTPNSWGFYCWIEKRPSWSNGSTVMIKPLNSSIVNGSTLQLKNVAFINITQYFGSNANIPQDLLDHPENWYRYDNGSNAYNTGTLVDSDGQYLECGGRNVWDEQWEMIESRLTAKNPIRVIPNQVYFQNSYGKLWSIWACDESGTKINGISISLTTIGTTGYKFTIPSNVKYIKFNLASTYGNIYHNDITISLYYTTGDGYDQYYPYEQPKVYDTGTETLRSAGSVRDYKDPDGTIHRLVGVVDLGTIDWDTYSSADNHVFRASLTNLGIKPTANNNVLANAICQLYSIMAFEPISASDNMCFSISSVSNNRIVFVNQSYSTTIAFKTAMSGVYLFYELAEETTEEGTPFSENIEINDYGTMSWLDSENAYVSVPQGCKIFYPVDYVLFIDSLGQREDIDWDVEEIVSQEQLSASETQRDTIDTQLKNALGGTLRQCLCVKESLDFDNTAFVDLGTLNYTYVSGANPYFISNAGQLTDRAVSQKMISTFYKVNAVAVANMSNLQMKGDGSTPQVYFINTNYTDATQFKNAMKGVLLAYEKASS